MRNFTYIFLLLLFACAMDSCAVVGGIFKAGVWVGVLIVVAIIALVLILVSKASGKK